MEIDLRRLDTDQLNIMLERANEQLRSALVNGEPWEEVEKKSQSGNGIRNLHKRASDVGARLSLVSSPGNGTRVTVTVDV